MEVSNNDSLKVEEKEDGSLEISWDSNDPKYSWMNDLTKEEISSILERGISEMMNNEHGSIH